MAKKERATKVVVVTSKTDDKCDKNKEVFYQAMVNAMGVVTAASIACGLSRNTHYRWMKEDKAYKKRIDDIGEQLLDLAESSLLTNIKERRSADVHFFLKTKGAKRGYGNKVELTGEDGGPIQVTSIFGKDLIIKPGED